MADAAGPASRRRANSPLVYEFVRINERRNDPAHAKTPIALQTPVISSSLVVVLATLCTPHSVGRSSAYRIGRSEIGLREGCGRYLWCQKVPPFQHYNSVPF